MERLLILNPGSTSTKIAVYEEETLLFMKNISHSSDIIKQYESIGDQRGYRKEIILHTLEENNFDVLRLTAIVSRGGLLPPVKAGAYRINEDMVWQLTYAPANEHASNLGAIIAFEISNELGIPAYIYDAVTVDEMLPIVKITGLPQMTRRGMGHNLNMRAAALRYAKDHKKTYSSCSVVVAHLGGGISVSLHHEGRIVDIISDEEGPFSPERAGGLPVFQLIKLAAKCGYDEKKLMKIVKTQGGVMAYFGINDTRQLEEKIHNGDEEAKLIYEAMALNVAKNIAELFPVVSGKVEAILLTGGIACSDYFTQMVKERIAYLAPIVIYPGENEMESLAFGGLRVLRGQEEAHEFVSTNRNKSNR